VYSLDVTLIIGLVEPDGENKHNHLVTFAWERLICSGQKQALIVEDKKATTLIMYVHSVAQVTRLYQITGV